MLKNERYNTKEPIPLNLMAAFMYDSLVSFILSFTMMILKSFKICKVFLNEAFVGSYKILGINLSYLIFPSETSNGLIQKSCIKGSIFPSKKSYLSYTTV